MNVRYKYLMTLLLTITIVLTTMMLVGCKKESEPTIKDVAVEEIEQKMCPVMSAPINEKLYTEYKGKKVYFCCPGCKGTFEKAPEKYLEKLPQFKN